MSLQGPIILVSDAPASALTERLVAAGAFPVIEIGPDRIAEATRSVQPAAVVLAGGSSIGDHEIAAAASAFGDRAQPYVPVIECTRGDAAPLLPFALPARCDAPPVLTARLRAALRVRTLHASVLRRAAALEENGGYPPPMPEGDPLDEATVIVAGRGRAYPGLSVAIGERVALIGALSLESAAGVLKSRDVDGIVIGDGFNKRVVDDFLAQLGTDARFRDLPVGVLDDVGSDIDPERLPNLDRVSGDAPRIAERMLPLMRLHAFTARLRRMAISLDARGVVDPRTGLRTFEAFMQDLKSAVGNANDRGDGLAVARFSLASLADYRASLDAARIVSRLVRTSDFACRDGDGTILVAFLDTSLAAAHVVARRIASVLKHTALSPGRDRGTLDPSVAIASLKRRDTVETLMARITAESMVAAG